MCQKSKTRTCSRCKREEGSVLFEQSRKICNSCRGQLQKYRKNYKEKNAAQSKKWREANPEKAAMMVRRANMKRIYGITLEQYDELLEKQEHKCAVCDRHESEFKTRLAVDHDHKTGEIFGLLCTYCNHRVIGRERDPVRFYRAAEYLSKGTGWIVPPKKKKRKKKIGTRPKRKK